MLVKNQELLNIITSTGVIINSPSRTYLFYDKYSGYLKVDNSCEFYNNLHLDVLHEKVVTLYQLFYYYPLKKKQISLSHFFRDFLLHHDLTEDYPFLWEIGKLRLYTETEKITTNQTLDAEYLLLLSEMRKIHGKNFTPEL